MTDKKVLTFVMDYDNIPGKGPLMLFRENGDGTRSLATVEDVKAFAAQESAALVEATASALKELDCYCGKFVPDFCRKHRLMDSLAAHRAKYEVKP